jgi:hypothetical protein
MANGLNQSDNQMNFGFGTRTIGGTELDLDAILGAQNTSSLLDILGLSGTRLPTDAFYTINPDTVQALDPNNPMYQQRITDLQQTALPSLQRSALNIGAGGRLGRSEGFMRNLRQQSMQPYLDSLAGTFRGIESDVGRARLSAENYLQDILSGFSDLDFQAPPPPTPFVRGGFDMSGIYGDLTPEMKDVVDFDNLNPYGY